MTLRNVGITTTPDPAALPAGPRSSFRWATVVNTDPLSVRMDGDSLPLGATPDTLVAVFTGDRVWTQLHGSSVIILGVGQ